MTVLWVWGLLRICQAGEADLALYRYQAALAAGDEAGAWTQAAQAVQADPLDWRAHQAWQDALLRANAGWWVEAEYRALAQDSDPARRFIGLTWEATRSGAPVPELPGADPKAQARVKAAVALDRGDARAALSAVEGLTDPDAVAIRLAALAQLEQARPLAQAARDARAQMPDRPDLLAPLWQEESLWTWLARCGATKDAEAGLSSSDPLTLYRAHALLVAAGEPELAQQASERLVALGEPWALGTRPPWRGVMVRDLARVLALQSDPQLPPGGTAYEEQRVLAATAKEQARKGHGDVAASTWRRALAENPPDAALVVEAALFLEGQGASPDELLTLARRARALAALSAELPHTAVQAQATLASAWMIEARALRALEDPLGALQAAQQASTCGAGAEALVMRGELLEQLNQPQAAFTAYAQAHALGTPGLEPRLEALYLGPASLPVVLAAWPSQRGTPDRAPEPDSAKFPSRSLLTTRGSVELGSNSVQVVSFWASWCGPCAQELPELNALAQRLEAEGLGVQFVAVSVDEQERDYERWGRSHSLNSLYIVRSPDLGRAARVQGIPSTWVLGPGGEVIWFHQGYSPGDVERLEAELRRVKVPAQTP